MSKNNEQPSVLLTAIRDEPELPGGMPDEMWDAIQGARNATEEAMRIAVRLTKQGIEERLVEAGIIPAANAKDLRSAEPPTTTDPVCPKCGTNRQVWNNKITGHITCHRVGCYTEIDSPNAKGDSQSPDQ